MAKDLWWFTGHDLVSILADQSCVLSSSVKLVQVCPATTKDGRFLDAVSTVEIEIQNQWKILEQCNDDDPFTVKNGGLVSTCMRKSTNGSNALLFS